MSESQSDGVSDGVESLQTSLFRPFEGIRSFDGNRLVLDLVACLIFLFRVAPTKFLSDELVIFFTVPPRGFDWRFRLGTALIYGARRASAEVNSEKLAELNDE
jgi:hypothetical protein